MRKTAGQKRQAFTLIELLVVVAIIALLISILLPSLTCAREQARTAKCAAQLRGIGTGVVVYMNESQDYIPGVNTSGGTFRLDLTAATDQIGYLRRDGYLTQSFDWITPALRTSGTLGNNRAERMQTLINRYQCPSNAGNRIDFLYPQGLSGVPDAPDFNAITDSWSPLSYLMPAHFQLWGQQDQVVLGTVGPRGSQVKALAGGSSWEVVIQKYRSKLNTIGVAARKIMAADGSRFLDSNLAFDWDVSPIPSFFGSFTSAGAWWCGDESYGVQQGSTNWDGMSVNAGSGSPSALGQALPLSYRHGCSANKGNPQTCQQNNGSINAMFFDGHVARLTDRQSRNIEFWYPRGAVVQTPSQGMTRVDANFEIP